jgi:hypothetical protein
MRFGCSARPPGQEEEPEDAHIPRRSTIGISIEENDGPPRSALEEQRPEAVGIAEQENGAQPRRSRRRDQGTENEHRPAPARRLS